MNRREALKGAGMAFSGAVLMRVRQDRPLEEHEFEPKPDWVRIVVDGAGTPVDCTVTVYDRAGNELPWLVRDFTVHYSIYEHRSTIQMHFYEGDERNNILISPEGFVMDHVFEGRVSG